ncbi:MAG: hypothetical protein M1826_003112 [Phylliscum demangeonii]|nr:MAG: hypothetical protein M1826_003112 [Phylliscum demangeonii]
MRLRMCLLAMVVLTTVTARPMPGDEGSGGGSGKTARQRVGDRLVPDEETGLIPDTLPPTYLRKIENLTRNQRDYIKTLFPKWHADAQRDTAAEYGAAEAKTAAALRFANALLEERLERAIADAQWRTEGRMIDRAHAARVKLAASRAPVEARPKVLTMEEELRDEIRILGAEFDGAIEQGRTQDEEEIAVEIRELRALIEKARGVSKPTSRHEALRQDIARLRQMRERQQRDGHVGRLKYTEARIKARKKELAALPPEPAPASTEQPNKADGKVKANAKAKADGKVKVKANAKANAKAKDKAKASANANAFATHAPPPLAPAPLSSPHPASILDQVRHQAVSLAHGLQSSLQHTLQHEARRARSLLRSRPVTAWAGTTTTTTTTRTATTGPESVGARGLEARLFRVGVE